MTTVYLDFETRSMVDLKRSGLHVYASDLSTEILCVAWAFDDDPVQITTPGEWLTEDAFGFNEVLDFISGGGKVVAHNAAFEIGIWNEVGVRNGWPTIRPDQTICTMVMAYAMALPGSLAEAALAVGLNYQKDNAGGRVMLQLSQPRDVVDGKPVWWDDAAKLERVMGYCKNDVEVERELYKKLRALSSDEKNIWLLDQAINARGVQVDLKAVKAAINLAEFERKRLDLEMQRVTCNQVATCNATGQIVAWLKFKGLEVPSIAKAEVTEVLVRPDLPSDVREALTLRQEAAKSSTAKLKAILEGASEDGRVRGLFQYHGSSTGRWAGRRVQLQNLPRPKIPQTEIESILDLLGRVD